MLKSFSAHFLRQKWIDRVPTCIFFFVSCMCLGDRMLLWHCLVTFTSRYKRTGENI